MATLNVSHICRYPGCQRSTYDRYCDLHPDGPPRKENRPNASSRGYDWQWQKERKVYLGYNPLCVQCLKDGISTPATVVDHIIPHKGDERLFWDIENNWQSLCIHHHAIKTAKEK